jgi:MFS family permease
MQNYIGYSAVQTGVRQLTISGWSLVLGPVAGILSSRFSKKWMIVGSMVIGGVGFFAMAYAISPTVSFVELWPGMVLMGITNGMVNPLLNTAGMEGARPQEMGMVSGLLNVFRQFGTTVGVVGLGLIQDAHYEAHLNNNLHLIQMPAKVINGIKDALINAGPFSGHTIAFSTQMQHMPFAATLQKIVIAAYDNGMAAVAISSGVIVLLGALGAAILMRNRIASQDIELKQEQ